MIDWIEIVGRNGGYTLHWALSVLDCDEHGERWTAAGARSVDHPQARAAHAQWDSDVTTSRQPTAHSLFSLQWCVSFTRPPFTGENSTVCDVTAPTNYRLHTIDITPTLFLYLSGVSGCYNGRQIQKKTFQKAKMLSKMLRSTDSDDVIKRHESTYDVQM